MPSKNTLKHLGLSVLLPHLHSSENNNIIIATIRREFIIEMMLVLLTVLFASIKQEVSDDTTAIT